MVNEKGEAKRFLNDVEITSKLEVLKFTAAWRPSNDQIPMSPVIWPIHHALDV